MKVLALAGSSSSTSINLQLAVYAAGLIPDSQVTSLDLRDFEAPIYSSDEESANGIPAAAVAFLEQIDAHGAIVISLAEHNGSYAAAFKNLYDWCSRKQPEVWGDKRMLLMATSPGARGGATVLATAKATFPRMGADLRAVFSLPGFYDNFSVEEGITEPDLASQLKAAVAQLSGSTK
ncbi:MAG: chromate reductase [Gammaproteobacteria bacterium]|jgi:NAD(P)H-dependent FMN reductase